MKMMKKCLALLLVAVLCLGMATVAMATDENAATYKLSIKTVANHTYKVYQLATGDVSADGNTLSNIAVGANAKAGTAVADITALVGQSGTDLGNAAYALIDEAAPINTVMGDGTTQTVTLPGGYYVVVDSFTTEGTVESDSDKLSPVMVEIVKDTTMTPKATGTPVDDKKIDEGEEGATASGKYSVGDDVPFVLTATMPSAIAVYDKYQLTFTDTMSTGLTFNNDVQVFVDDSETALDASAYTVAATENGFTVSFADVKADPINAVEGTVIKVKYTAELNENALERNEETNESHITYSNDPKSDSTGETEDKEVKVFDFSFDVNKIDGETKEALTGAGFTLYKWNAETEEYTQVEEIEAADDTSVFNFKGLGEGQYKLVESTTPDGYNTMTDVEFKIVPVIENNVVTSLKATTLEGEDLYPGDATKYSIAAEIENDKGTNLPSTGGIGTTIFYVIGGILVVGAGVLLITKKRMSHNG